MNPSSSNTNFPSHPPFGDLSKTHVINQGRTCRHCGTPVKTLVSVFVTFNLRCPSCGRRDTDLASWWIVDKRDKRIQRMASPEFSSLEQIQQFAALFGIRPEDDYGITECIHFYNSERDAKERADHIVNLEWNGALLAWLLKQRPSYEGDDGLVQLAVKAHLTGYALPQFRAAAEKGA